ncbi:MAG: PAS domain S-box protein [Bacteroidetes bacterium]|nr:PAS domain S-box protein [Bacteroidota bacterium]
MGSYFYQKLSDRFIKIDRNFPLEKFIPTAFLIFLLCVFILSIITYHNIERYKSDLNWINHSNEVIKQVEDLKSKLFEIPFTKTGYANTGEKDYLSRYDLLVNDLNNSVINLKKLTSEDTGQQKLLFEIDSLATKNISIIKSSLTDTVRADSSSSEYSERQVKTPNIIQNNLAKIKEITSEFRENEITILKSRTREADRTNSKIQLFILITGLFSFAVIGFSLYISDILLKNKNKTDKLLLESYSGLEKRVNERTLELQETNEKLHDEITVRKKTEDILRESEQRFRLLADSAPVLIWICDKNKQYNYFNKAWLEFTGRSIDQETGNGWRLGVHPDDLKKSQDVFITAFDKKEPFEMEYRLRNSRGDYIWLMDKGIPRYEGNEFAGYTGSCMDINEIKKNERFLKIQYDVSKTLAESDSLEEASGNLLRNICSDIGWNFGILWLADEKNEYVKPDYFWSEDDNDAALNSGLYNDSMKFSKGMDFTGTIFKEGKSMWTKDLSNAKSFKRLEGLSRKGWNSGLGIPISNGKETIAIFEFFNKKHIEEKKDLIEVLESAGRQIGNFIERKKSEEKLRLSYIELEKKVKDRTNELANALTKLIRENEEKELIQNKIKLFAHAVRSIKDCVFITDLNLRTIFVNEAFETTYGYYLSEISEKEIPILSDDNVSAGLKKDVLERNLMKGWKGELMTKRKDGTTFNTYLSTSFIRNDEGDANSIVGICQDISEIKNAEEELRKTNAILVETQNELIYNEKFAALGRFSSGVAHEIRNPLANISSLAQLISKTSLDEKNKRRLNYIISNVEIANKIIKNLLSFATPGDLDFREVNLGEMLGNVLENVEARCNINGIKIVKDIPGDLSLLHLDKLKLENAFMNFISNSIESMSKGGTLTVRVQEDKVCKDMIIDIIDTGVGISEENIDKILEPFFTTKDDGVGLGMGLSYQTIILHKGKFKIESKVGKGTTIHIKLPI